MKDEAQFAYSGLDRVIHERARLGVLTSLITHADGLGFAELKRLCALTDGNLARHLQVLEDEGMVKLSKEVEGTRLLTAVRITTSGRKRYLQYLSTLEQIIHDAAGLQKEDRSNGVPSRLTPRTT